MNFRFEYADKNQIDDLLPSLFDILYANMREITPSGKSREEEFNGWFSEVYPAMQKAPRQIVLMLDGDKIIGYFQYYTRDALLMMEEIQIKKEYHGSGIFGKFYSWLVRELPDNLETVEAFADRRNTKSRSILNHLGLIEISTEENGLLHFRGEYDNIKERYSK
ncbi:MAG: hypothetical protein E7628_02940 [Ruminococcaceae bacterium]|nr:hypothetical protein [Oscillospiraceae bacterium]